MRRFYNWCLRKCQAILGAVTLFLSVFKTRVSTPRQKKHGRLFKRVLLLLTVILMSAVMFSPRMYTTNFGPTDYTFTGSATWVSDGGAAYRLKFLTSGTLITKKNIIVDVWFLGGGAGGGNSNGSNSKAGGGGGGGRTGYWANIILSAGQPYVITIGAGGPNHSAGGVTSLVGGGLNGAVAGGDAIIEATHYLGTNGGCGGGAATRGNGGSNGGNGANGDRGAGGTGQGTTTYEFGDSSLTLYAGGGGAGGGAYPDNWTPGTGGWGGGANGGNGWSNLQNGNHAAANTGGGGGGAGVKSGQGAAGGWGGSGIIVIRNHR